MNMSNIGSVLVLGSGVVGTLVSTLLKDRYKVTSVDRTNLAGKVAGVTFKEGDVTDREFLHSCLKEHDAVISMNGAKPDFPVVGAKWEPLYWNDLKNHVNQNSKKGSQAQKHKMALVRLN